MINNLCQSFQSTSEDFLRSSLCENNNNTQNVIKQEFSSKYFHLLYLRGLKGARERVLNVLIKYDVFNEFNYVSRETLSEQSGVSVRHVARILKELEEVGIISRVHKHVRRTEAQKVSRIRKRCNDYTLHWIFYELWSRQELSYKYPYLKIVDLEKIDQKERISKGHFWGLERRKFLYSGKPVFKRPLVKNVPLYININNDSTFRQESESEVFNISSFLFKNNTQDNGRVVGTQSVERKLRVSGAKQQRGDSMLEKLRQVEAFGNYEIQQLEQFSEKVLEDAYKVLMATPNITNRFRYLLGVCNKLAVKPSYKAAATKQSAAVGCGVKEYKVYRAFEHPSYDDTCFEELRKPSKQTTTADDRSEYEKLLSKISDGSLEKLASVMGEQSACDFYRRVLNYWKPKLEEEVCVDAPKQEQGSPQLNETTGFDIESLNVEEESDTFDFWVDG